MSQVHIYADLPLSFDRFSLINTFADRDGVVDDMLDKQALDSIGLFIAVQENNRYRTGPKNRVTYCGARCMASTALQLALVCSQRGDYQGEQRFLAASNRWRSYARRFYRNDYSKGVWEDVSEYRFGADTTTIVDDDD